MPSQSIEGNQGHAIHKGDWVAGHSPAGLRQGMVCHLELFIEILLMQFAFYT